MSFTQDGIRSSLTVYDQPFTARDLPLAGFIIPALMSKRKDDKAASLFESGLRHFHEGHSEQARLYCEQAVALSPRNSDALHLLGIIALQRADHAAAVEWLRQAVALRPDDPACHCNLAYGYVGLKRLPEALAAFERAARLDPGDAGLALGVGNCLAMLGRPQEAEAALRRLVERHPQYALGWFNLGNALKDQKRYDEARELYVRTTRLAPRFAEAYSNLGVCLHKLDHLEEAERAYRASIEIDPRSTNAHVNLAITLNSLRRHEEAEALCREALAREPGQKNAWPVLGKACFGQRRWHDVVRCCEEAVNAFPESSDALGDLGQALACIGRPDEALHALDRAYALGNVSAFVHFFKATTLFSLGRIAEGAIEYMGRHERATFVEEHPDLPLAWGLPGDLAGREVGLIGEQGVGDEIFFLRYAPLLKARGCRMSYCGNQKITGILARTGLFERAASNFGCVAAADVRILVGDLPYLLGVLESSRLDLGSPVPGAAVAEGAPGARFPWQCRVYWPELPPPLALSPLPERVASVRARLQQLGSPPYVGLTWRAGTGPQEQRGKVWFLYKEAALESLAATLREVPGTLISLQREPRPDETERLATLVGRPVHDLSAANEDLEEMLACLAVLDEYVGVSSTNMHLRASVGRTARVLVPWPAEWRWLASGDESPWFPGFRTYRQGTNGDWGEAVARLRSDLHGS